MPQEHQLKIKLENNFCAYGRLRGSLKKPLFIMVHGLTGSIYDGFYQQATDWFVRQGFAAFRFNLYGWQKDARQLIDCTLETHARDLDSVVRYFHEKGVKKIFVAGHSFGGPTILLSKEQNFDAAALWDPSYDISFTKKKYGFPGGKYVKELNGYLMRWGVNAIMGRAMAQELDRMKWNELPQNFHVPLKILVAEKGDLIKGAKIYFENANAQKSLSVIKGATHYFDDQEGMQEHVFQFTKEWFEKIGSKY